MKKRLHSFFRVYFLVLLFITASSPAAAQKNRHVLFISSYGYDWPTVPLQLQGFAPALPVDILVDYLFMDSKKYPKDEIWPLFRQRTQLNFKYRGTYDAVVTGDDNALRFVLAYRDSMFKDIPVIFEGVDSTALAAQAHASGNITGIIEDHFNAENISLALLCNPGMKKAVVLTDDTVSGIASLDQFRKSLEGRDVKVTVEYFDVMKYSRVELMEKFSEMKKDVSIILLNFTFDKDGNSYDMMTASSFIREHSRAPLFSAITDICCVAGGVSVNYRGMGAEAADLVKLMYGGTDLSSVEPRVTKPSVQINYGIMKTYNLKLPSRLPDNASVFGRPKPFASRYYHLIILCCMIVIIGMLVLIMVRRQIMVKKQQKLIAELRGAKSAQEDFLSRMSHDMRTPMNAVIGLANFGLEENDAGRMKTYFRQITSSAKYLMGLLNDLLDMSKLESGKTHLHPELAEGRELVDDVITIIRPRMLEKHHEFVTDFSGHTFRTVVIDKLRAEQILVNVLNNAAKYTPEGGRIEWTVTEKVVDGTVYAVHTVSDNGVGMSEQFQKRLFIPFSQERNALTTSEGGSGLGMAISKNLIELMGGSITCTSELGKGSVFTMCFPLIICDAPAAAAVKQEMTDTSVLSGKHALICEDNEINMMIEQKLLEDKGCITDTAPDGKVAVQKARNGGYDIILMDVRMPVMNGIDAVKAIRAFDAVTPIVAVSANAYEDDVRQSLQSGMDAHLVKPIETDKFFDVISHLCASGRIVQ